MAEGIVFKIQKYSVHDGPGIRTAVFLKGCPMDCWWCHNPEGKEVRRRIFYSKGKCIGCGACIAACTNSAITFSDGILTQIREKCVDCIACVKVCPTNAIEAVGESMTVSELMEKIERDVIFYDESGGGVTFTGGEPFYQAAFLLEALESCKRLDIHTAVETSGCTSWENLQKACELVNLFYYDLKLMDERRHKKYTGVSNKTIKENLEKLASVHGNICIRLPLIPGINDDMENIEQTCGFLMAAGLWAIDILPYHSIGMYKYEWIGDEYRLPHVKPHGEDKLSGIAEAVKAKGLSVRIGGRKIE